MNKSILKMLVFAALLALICAGCTSENAGVVVGSVLQGIGAGLSGL